MCTHTPRVSSPPSTVGALGRHLGGSPDSFAFLGFCGFAVEGRRGILVSFVDLRDLVVFITGGNLVGQIPPVRGFEA